MILAEQLNENHNKKCTVYPPELASILRLRDATNNGYIPEQVLQRVTDEEMSLVAEGIKGHLNIPFDYALVDGSLRAADGQEWLEIMRNGINYFEEAYLNDSRFEFLLKRAIYEYEEAHNAEDLAKGDISCQTLLTISPYPEEAANEFGKQFIRERGCRPERKLAFIRAIERTPEGVRMYSRGIDNSKLSIWNDIVSKIDHKYRVSNSNDLVKKTIRINKKAIDALDQLQEDYESYFGITRSLFQKNDVWLFMQSQKELTDYFIEQLTILSQSDLEGEELLLLANELRYQYWSTMSLRFKDKQSNNQNISYGSVSSDFVGSANIMASQGEKLYACNNSISYGSRTSTSSTLSSVDGMQKMMLDIFGEQEHIQDCVNCPFCHRIVKARIGSHRSTIECLRCRAKVNCKTGKRIDHKSENDPWSILDIIFPN